ncbi:gpW family head-tail joining protein [Oceanospirillum maris]|uniref:gpW family head-tail joining protein n=1 Tax=Oceanospirillum maris TaxID=64977 RepID=UPI00040831E1|nr:gpW family head-tail joining protein [Oceanospirillum maris]
MATTQQLQEAKAALHNLMTGKAVVSLQRDGRKVEYTPANKAQLQNYINQLESELNARSVRRAFRFY